MRALSTPELRVLVLILLLLLPSTPWMLASAASGVDDPNPLQPPATSSPRDTLQSFLTNANQVAEKKRQLGGAFDVASYPPMLVADSDAAHRSQHSKGLQQPEHHRNDDHDIQDVLDLSIHGDIGVDEPKQYANDDQDND